MSRNTTDIKIPQLRFKGFKEAWEQCKLKNIFTEVVDNRGKTPPLSNEGIPLIEIASVGEHDVNYERVSKFLSDYSYANNLRDYLLEGDLLFSTVGTTALTSIYKSNVTAAVAQNIIGLRSKKYYPSFLHYLISNSTNNSQIKTIQMTGVQFSIKVPQLLEVDLLVSKCYQEQLKIGSLLASLDHIITLHQRKHDKLVNVKKSLLDKMFPKEGEKVPQLRFKGFKEAWEQRELESLAIKLDNLRVPVSEVDRVPGPTPYYGANGIQGYVQGYTHQGEFILVAEDGANDLKNYPVQYVNGEVWVNNHAHVLQGKLDFADTRYLGYAISQTNIEPFLVGGGRAKLNASTMMKIMISTPQNTQEQQKIGSLFDSIDSLITLHQRKLEKLTSIKKSLLEKMFA